MNKIKERKLFLVSGIAIVFTLMIFTQRMFAEQGNPFLQIHEELIGITGSERESLNKLFVLVQEIEEMEREESEVTQLVEKLDNEIKVLGVMISDEELAYEKNRGIMEQVLKSYQRQGPGSYLEIIFESENLTMFIRRLNILQEITHNTGDLLTRLEKSKEMLAAKKIELAKKLEVMWGKQEELRESLTKKLQLKKDMEMYIASLGEQRVYYEKHLSNLQKVWDDLKPLFAQTASEITNLVKNDDLLVDALKVSFGSYGIKASIDEKTFNDIAIRYPHLPKMIFSFQTDKTEIRMPDKELVLTGTFTILEGHTVKFDAKEGSFYGLPLETSSIEALFSQGYLLLDLKSLMGGFSLHSVEIQEGNLEFIIKPVLYK